jgi:hypothetical protein
MPQPPREAAKFTARMLQQRGRAGEQRRDLKNREGGLKARPRGRVQLVRRPAIYRPGPKVRPIGCALGPAAAPSRKMLGVGVIGDPLTEIWLCKNSPTAPAFEVLL